MAGDNEQQIDEIMNELEELKKEVTGTGTDVSAADADLEKELEGFRSAGGEASMEDTLSDIKEEAPPSGKSLLDADVAETETVAEESKEESKDDYDADELEQELEKELAEQEEAKVIPYRSNNQSSEDGALTLTLKGDINLKLRYESGGQDVSVSFSDGFLHVELADGSEFKIPVGSSKRKAA
jgi:hypothetical protein